MMDVRNCLRELRLESGLTQEALANAVGVTRQTIISLEKGRYVPSIKLALHLARVLDVGIEDLFWLEKHGRGERS